MDTERPNDPSMELNGASNQICDCIEHLLLSATHRRPQGSISDVLRRIVLFMVEYYSIRDITADDIDKLVCSLWCVLISEDIHAPLRIASVLLPGISAETSRLSFVGQYASEWCVLAPIPNVSAGIWTAENSSHGEICHRFEEFLVSTILFHLVDDPGGWVSMPVQLSKLLRFIDTLSISEHEPVCRNLLTSMVVVDQLYFERYSGYPPGWQQLKTP